MANIAQLLTEHIDIWTAADTVKKSGRGRASGNAGSVYGVKKLRELILELAVRGKLVPQDANDEPASELLKRIPAEKAKLIAEGKLRKEKALAPITEDEKPFDLPNGWEWIRLGQTGKVFNGNSINENEKLDKYTNLRSGRPFIATKDVGYGREELNYENGVLIPFEDETLKIAHKGAVLICAEGGSAGKKIGITNKDICFGNKLFANEVWPGIEPYYIFHLYQSKFFYSSFSEKMTGIIGGISLNEFLSISIPLPSLNEQHRIVAKMDELMALCDQLEQQHSIAQDAHEILVSQLLATLTQSQNAVEFNVNWQRIYAHFDVLFTTETIIDALKQTLLQLAVMGKLVPQDSKDEHASVSLARLKEKGGNIKVRRGVQNEVVKPDLLNEDVLPKSWEVISIAKLLQLSAILDLKDGNHGANHPKVSEFTEVGVPFITAAQVSENGVIDYEGAYKLSGQALKRIRVGFAEAGDVIYTHKGSVGRVALCNSKCILTPQTTYYRLNNEVFRAEFVCIYLRSPQFRNQVDIVKRQTTRDFVSINAQYQFFFYVPPLAEQHRIVAKVDALMALCDQLKTRIQQANQQQQIIANALVTHAVA